MIRDKLAISPGFVSPRPPFAAQTPAVPAAMVDRLELSSGSDAHEAAGVVASMVKGHPDDVKKHLPLITSSLQEAFGTQTLKDLKSYGLTIELDSSVAEYDSGKLLLGLYNPRSHTVILSPRTLEYYSSGSRARQIVIHETTHGVDDMKKNRDLQGAALEAHRQHVSDVKTPNTVFYASTHDETLKTLQQHFENRVVMTSWAVDMNDASKKRVTNHHADYKMVDLPDGRRQVTQHLIAATPSALLRIRSGLHSLALGLGGVPGAAALARKTAPFDEFNETVTLRDGQKVEFTHTRTGSRMVFPKSLSAEDYEDIRFSKYAYDDGRPLEYLAESAAHFLSDAQSREQFERIDPNMAGYLLAQFPPG